jgi:transcriptional regulator with PAS, ATPase and Fis domain
LFGTVKGAFTDAKRDRAGHFATADGGTILLDELCEFRIEMQPKLLRVLEERRFYPVGSDRERRVNVRVLAATNRDPDEAILKGQLREDLYYRLSTVILSIPPLRERAEDVLPLARAFLQGFGAEFGRSSLALSAAAEAALMDHPWPGNVRELRNVIERAVMMTDGQTVEPSALQLRLPGAPSSRALPAAKPAPTPSAPDAALDMDTSSRGSLAGEFGSAHEPDSGSWRLDDARQKAMDLAEREHIERVLRKVGGSKTRAAELLGISRSTLWEKLKRYGIS